MLVRSLALGVIVALMLLAGHTQTVYISLFGLGMWVVWPFIVATWHWLFQRIRRNKSASPSPIHNLPFSIHHSPFSISLLIYISGILLGVLLSAVQLLPTLELSRLSLRSSGLDYFDATSFSLKPLQLGWTLLPGYGLVDLEAIFATPAFTEFVAYVGLAGLMLAIVGAWKGRGTGRVFGMLFICLGLFLALGRWNPFYLLLYNSVPGFGLFRVPARWLLLYTMGMAVLAGVGMERVAGEGEGRGARDGRETSHSIVNCQLSIVISSRFSLFR